MNDKEIIEKLRSTVFKIMEKNRKLEMVINLMVTKRVYESVILSTDSCYAYNSLMDPWDDQLKEEEYNLVKEVFNYVLH